MAEKKKMLKATARPAGFTATAERMAEAERRAAEFRKQQQAKREQAALNKTMRRKPPRRLWDNFEQIAVIQKSYKLRICINAATRDGFRCVTIREQYLRKEDNTWQPGRSGIVIPLHVPLHRTRKPDTNDMPVIIHPMSEFLPAFIKAIEYAETMDLADPEKAVFIYSKTEEKQDENR